MIKMRPDGTTLFALPAYAGSAAGVDRDGNILVVLPVPLPAFSSLPATADAPQRLQGPYYLARLDPNGNLISATYFGGLWLSNLLRVFFDPNGDVYVLGSANGTFANQDPYFPNLIVGKTFFFIMKWRPGERKFPIVSEVTGLVNINTQMSVDAAGDVVFATPLSSQAPYTTSGVLQPTYSGLQDIYIIKLDSSGSRLVYATYLSVTPGSKSILSSAPRALAVDRAGNAWIASSFNDSSGTTGGGVGNTLIELSSDGSSILHSESSFAVFGDRSLFLDTDGNLIAIGSTDLTLPTNLDAPLRAPCGFGIVSGSNAISFGNFYYRKLSPEGKELYASYILAASVAAFDPQGRPYTLQLPDFRQAVSTQNIVRQDFSVQTQPGVACLINPARGLAQNSFLPPPYIVPGQLVTIAGSALGPVPPAIAGLNQEGKDQQGSLPLELAGVRVLLDGVSVPMVSAQYGLITISVPAALPIGTTVNLEVESNGLKTSPLPVVVAATAFFLFAADGAGRGPVAAINQDGSTNSLSHPAKVGSVVSAFGTGTTPNARIQVAVNGRPATIEYAGPAPGLVPGVVQVNFRVPPANNGTALLSVSAGQQPGIPSPAVTLEVEN